MTYLEIKDFFKKITFVPPKPALFFRIMQDYFHLVFLKQKRLRVIDIWATEKCQCNCRYCCNAALMRSSARKLSLKVYKEIFIAARKLGVLNIHFVGGEPLLCDDLYELITLSKPGSMIVSLVTNGILLKTKAKDLKKAGLDLVNVSIDSPYSTIHDKQKNYQGAFNAAIEGIIAAKNAGLQVILAMIVTHQNLNNGEVEKMISFTEKLKVEFQLLPARPVGSWYNNNDIILNRIDMKKFYILASKWKIRWDGRTTYIKTGCPAGVEKMTVDIFGNIYPCDFIPFSFGNIFKNSLEEIYYSMCNSSIFKKWSPVCRSAFDPEFMENIASEK